MCDISPDISAENHVTVISHSKICDSDSKIIQIGFPAFLAYFLAGGEAFKKILYTILLLIEQNMCGTVGIQTACLTAVAYLSARAVPS